ncbi:MAG: DUF917 family protein [Synergistaceae bacterium]|nr:DUF917 family protein [Synergistaceae bacterium]
MSKRTQLDFELLRYAITGGTILGGGGGGNPDMGREFAELALQHGDLYLTDIHEIPDDAIILTVSNVGAPAALNRYLTAEQTLRPIQLILRNKELNIGGIITNEQGGGATVNGWYQAAILGIPLLDAPCNGRAHPTGVMGSLNLHKIPDYVTVQGATGGNPATNDEIECFAQGSINHTSRLVRAASIEAGGVVSVARNPITVAYAKENCAIGGISHAIETGRTYTLGLDVANPAEAIQRVTQFLDGRRIARGIVNNFSLETVGGYDIGKFHVNDMELTFWNEYMTWDDGDMRVATFPELIMTFDAKTGTPLTTAMIENDRDVFIICTAMKNLRLSSTMYEPDLIREVEEVIGKEMLKYLDLTRP